MNDKPKLLLVDDLPANLHTLSAALAKDYDLSIAISGETALSLAKQIEPDLILLDVMMPNLDGFQTMARLRATYWGKHIPVILITADDRIETQVNGLEQGADDFITKPVVIPVVQARVRNLLERQRLRRELFRLATGDGLTGAFNRRYFLECGEIERRRTLRHGYPSSVLMLDIDHFKSVNDLYGHALGDRVLQVLAQTLKAGLRDSDILGRLGGEEFAILLPHSDQAGVLLLAERLRVAVEQSVLPLDDGGELRVKVSIGVTQIELQDHGLEAALRRADAALYAAKTAGRNRVCVAEREACLGPAA